MTRRPIVDDLDEFRKAWLTFWRVVLDHSPVYWRRQGEVFRNGIGLQAQPRYYAWHLKAGRFRWSVSLHIWQGRLEWCSRMLWLSGNSTATMEAKTLKYWTVVIPLIWRRSGKAVAAVRPAWMDGEWQLAYTGEGKDRMVHVRWSVPNSRGHFYVQHYPATGWGEAVVERTVKEWNQNGKVPWEFREWRP